MAYTTLNLIPQSPVNIEPYDQLIEEELAKIFPGALVEIRMSTSKEIVVRLTSPDRKNVPSSLTPDHGEVTINKTKYSLQAIDGTDDGTAIAC